MSSTLTPRTARSHTRPGAPARRSSGEPRLAHRHDVQEEWVRELSSTSSLRVRSRPVVLRRTGDGRLAS